MRQYKPSAVLQIWNADGSITLYAGGRKQDRFKSSYAAESARNWLKGWFNDGPQRVRHVFKFPKAKKEAA